jgi:hypothetical protein
MGAFFYRLMGAATFDVGVFEQIEADRRATIQAVIVVLVASLALGFGISPPTGGNFRMFALVSVTALTTWVMWAAITLVIGARIMPEPDTQSNMGEVLRTIGFAAAPGWLQALAALSDVKWPFIAVTSAWMLASMVVALRQALDYTSTWRAIVVCLIAAGLIAVMILVLSQSVASMSL